MLHLTTLCSQKVLRGIFFVSNEQEKLQVASIWGLVPQAPLAPHRLQQWFVVNMEKISEAYLH